MSSLFKSSSSSLLHHGFTLCVSSVFVVLSFWAHPAVAIQMVYNSSIPTTLSDACSKALLSQTTCDPIVRNFRQGFFYTPETLNRACTSACRSSLGSYHDIVQSACGNETLLGSFDLEMSVLMVPGTFQYLFESLCLQDNGQYCNNVAATAAAIADPGSIPTPSPCRTSDMPSDITFSTRVKLTEYSTQIACSIISKLSPPAQFLLALAIRAF